MSRLTGLAIFVFIGAMVTLFYGLIMHSCFHYHYPMDTPFFIPGDRFMDFFNTSHFVKSYTYINQPLAVYFPFAYWVLYPFTLIPPNLSLAIFIFTFTFYIIYIFRLLTNDIYQDAKRKNKTYSFYCSMIILIIFSFPFLFTIDRGNIEVFVLIFSSTSLYFFKKEKYYTASIFLSFSAGLKLYPFVFLLLFLKRKQYKAILLSILLFLLLSALVLLTLKGGFSNNLTVFGDSIKEVSASGFYTDGIPNSLSLMSLIKMASIILYKVKHAVPINYEYFKAFVHQISSTYSLCVLLYISIIAASIYFLENRLWAQIMQLTLLILVCPTVSYDYKLINLFIPLAFFLNNQMKERGLFDRIYLVLFALLLIPKNYYMYKASILHFSAGTQDLYFSLAVVLNITICFVFSFLLAIEAMLHLHRPSLQKLRSF